MVYMLMNYDMKFKEGQKRPESLLFETQNLPNHEATVLFRRRRVRGVEETAAEECYFWR